MKPILIRAAAACLSLGLIAGAAPALAHHSASMFDRSKTTVLNGTIKELQWTNPHVIVWIYAPAAKPGAEPDLWAAELTSPGRLTRNGWTKRSLKPGDKVVAEINPLRDGRHGGGLSKVTVVATGVVLTSDIPPPDAKKP